MTVTAVWQEKTLFFILAHVVVLVIVVNIFSSDENCFEYIMGQTNQKYWRDKDLGKPKSVLNQRRIFYFLSKAASLEPLYPVDQSCSLIER